MVTQVLREVVIAAPLRTPIGRYGGVLKDVAPVDLGSAVIRAIIDRTSIAPEDVEDVIMGQCYPNAEAPAIGRAAALDAGYRLKYPACRSTGDVVRDCKRSYSRRCRCKLASPNLFWPVE
jgi:acetyl-CoA acetyltransferase